MTAIIQFFKIENSGEIINLSQEQMEFIKFCNEHYEDIMILKNDGFFDLKNGQYTKNVYGEDGIDEKRIIKKDDLGVIREINRITYKYGKNK